MWIEGIDFWFYGLGFMFGGWKLVWVWGLVDGMLLVGGIVRGGDGLFGGLW